MSEVTVVIGPTTDGCGVSQVRCSVYGTFAAGGDMNASVFTLENDHASMSRQQIALTTGANTISVPTSAGGYIIIAPTANTKSLQVDGQTNSWKKGWMLACFDTKPATLSITASGATTIHIIWI